MKLNQPDHPNTLTISMVLLFTTMFSSQCSDIFVFSGVEILYQCLRDSAERGNIQDQLKCFGLSEKIKLSKFL